MLETVFFTTCEVTVNIHLRDEASLSYFPHEKKKTTLVQPAMGRGKSLISRPGGGMEQDTGPEVEGKQGQGGRPDPRSLPLRPH